MRRTRSTTTTRRLRQFAAAATTLAVVTGLTSFATTSAAPPTTDPETAGDYAAGWIATQLDAGVPLQNSGSADWGSTLDAAIALAATETGAPQLDAVWAALLANREAIVAPQPSGLDQPGRLARVILLAHAIGESPTSVGAGPGNDLVARLGSLITTTGDDTGLYGDPVTLSPTYDGAFRQGYSIAALVAAGATVPATAWQWLEAQQCDDGSWMPYRAVVGGVLAACAFDAMSFVGPDSNSTAAAINGLAAIGEGDTAIDDAATWLATVQNADGGWGYFPADASEPSSTALVWQALVHSGHGTDAPFLSKSATPLQNLLSFQLGCSSPEAERGALTYPGSNDAPSVFSTVQAVPALVGVPLEFGPTTPTATIPVVDCSTPTTTTTAPTTASVPVATTVAPGGGSSAAPRSVAAESAARPISFVG